MERESASVWRLRALRTAINERIERLESRKRLPRGRSVSDVRNELQLLEGEALRLGRLLHDQLRAEADSATECHALTQGGVEIGGRVPADRNPSEAEWIGDGTTDYADRV